MWIQLLPTALITYSAAIIYNLLYRQEFSSAVWSESLAAAGGILIGLSFVLSGISYFFDFADKHLKARKELGIYGYFFALIYSLSLQFRFPDRYFFGLKANLFESEVLLGLAAMAIFTFMTLISTKYGIKILGPKLWRGALRSGYIAYFLLIIRAFIVEGDIWKIWLETYSTLPPPRLLLTIFAVGVIVLRIALSISLRLRSSKAK
jgi:hypothetical protein